MTNLNIDPEKRYSNKSNARRAAKNAGLDMARVTIEADDDGFFICYSAPKKQPNAEKPTKAAKAPRKTKGEPSVESGEKGPSGMVATILQLASREEGVTPAELNEVTQWKGAPWKWLFQNPKKTGYCDRWGYTLEVTKTGREVCYSVTKKAA